MGFTHLLLPFDGTEMAERVLPVARGLASPGTTRITLLHMLEKAAPERKHGEQHLRAAAEAEAYLRGLATRELSDCANVDIHVHDQAVKDVAASLAEHMQEYRPDLIVMCAHGNQWWNEWVRGNLAQRALHVSMHHSVRELGAPVLLIQPGSDGRVAFPFRRILVPLDGSDAHEHGLDPAMKIAARLHAPLLLFTAISADATLRGSRPAATTLVPHASQEILRIAEEEAAAHLEEHVRALQAAGVEASGRVARVEPARGILQTAAETQTDLIVLGTHALSATESFWAGSVTPRVLQGARTSFLLAPGRQV